MKKQPDWSLKRLTGFALLSFACSGNAMGDGFIIKTSDGIGADAQVTENDNLAGGDGTGDAINARWAPGSLRNEYILLRFDLASIEPGSVTNASLNLTSFRNKTSQTANIYGLKDAAGGQTWDESTISFNNAPALTFDADSITRGLVTDDVTLLGSAQTPAIKGQLLTFPGSGGSLIDFLNTDTDGLVIFLIEIETNTGNQSRFASKEATALDGGTPSGSAGDFAPYLNLGLIPPDTPLVENAPVSGVTPDSAILNGSLTSTGASATVVGVLWGHSDGGTDPAAWGHTNWFSPQSLSVPPSASYSTNITGLSVSNAYYYTFIATNGQGVGMASPSKSFITGDVWVEASDPSGHENGDSASFSIYRPNLAANLPLTANYSLGGTASNGVDYSYLSGTAIIPAGELSETITVEPFADTETEADETVVLTITSGSYVIGMNTYAQAVITNGPVRPSVALAGDSTVAPNGGWGPAFPGLVLDGVTVNNQAVSSRSTKSYMDEGRWSTTVNLDGDYVFIQFGHNDQKLYDSARGTYPVEQRPAGVTPRGHDMFRANLREMIADVRSRGGVPVLITPVARRTTDGTGLIEHNENDSIFEPDAWGNAYSLFDYANAVKAVGSSENVTVIDLNQLSLDLYAEMVNNGEDITTLGPSGDNTHFNDTGARVIAELVAKALLDQLPDSNIVDPALFPRTVTTNHSVPHSWLASYDSSWTNDAEAEILLDHDGDGYSTWEEYWAGTNPQASNSYLQIDSVLMAEDNVRIEWRHYNPDTAIPPIAVFASSNLIAGPWFYAGEHDPTDGTNTWEQPASQQMFYQLVVTNLP